MIYKIIQSLSYQQWCCLWGAYWRLWGAQLRIKLKQQTWIVSKVSTGTLPEYAESSIEPHKLAYFEEMHESVRLAARCHFGQTACLPRSIVLADLLQKQGHNALVKLGVSKKAGQFASHAWVEVDGVMIGEPDSVEQDFSAFKL